MMSKKIALSNSVMPPLHTLAISFFFLLAWQIVASSGLVSNYLLPTPGMVWNTAMVTWHSGLLPGHIAASLFRIALGFSLSVLTGVFMAGMVTRFSSLQKLLSAPFAFMRMTPPLALIPLLILWLGIGGAIEITIIILASFFPVFLATRDGLCRVSEAHVELARSLNLSPWTYVTRIAIPSAVPSIITGLRLAFGYSWRALIGAELIAASSGLGYMIMDAQEMQRTDEVFVGILAIGVMGWILDALFSKGCGFFLRRRFPEIAE